MIFNIYRIYATYRKAHPITNDIYVGRTSGWVKIVNLFSGKKIVERRDRYHHRNIDGYGTAELDQFSTNKDAIRGREQLLRRIQKERHKWKYIQWNKFSK